MRYEILGSLRVVDANGSRFVGARKLETLLIVLLVRADQVVSVDALITEIWGGEPPTRVTASLQVHISRLRKFLHRSAVGRERIVTRPNGYLLRLGTDELDAHLFERIVEKGRAHLAARQNEAAAASFRNALELWRGPLAEGSGGGPIVSGFASWLHELRLECLEMLVHARLELGQHRELIRVLYQLNAEYPMREHFVRQLMLALYRSGRQADALAAYMGARQKLDTELGLQPSRQLTGLYHAILVNDRQLDWGSGEQPDRRTA